MTDSNGGPFAGLQGYLEEIDRQDDELLSLRSSYMEECKGPRGEIKEIMASAKEAGVNMKSFRVLLAKHRADRAHDKHVAALEQDDAHDLAKMKEALGDFLDLPLGQAAYRAAGGLDGEIITDDVR